MVEEPISHMPGIFWPGQKVKKKKKKKIGRGGTSKENWGKQEKEGVC